MKKAKQNVIYISASNYFFRDPSHMKPHKKRYILAPFPVIFTTLVSRSLSSW
jgi:hypothetical protein